MLHLPFENTVQVNSFVGHVDIPSKIKSKLSAACEVTLEVEDTCAPNHQSQHCKN